MMRGQTRTEINRLASAPVDVEHGKLTWRDGMLMSAFVLASFAVGALGGLLAAAVGPGYTGEPLSSWRLTLMLLGSISGISSVTFGVVAGYLQVRGWIAHAARVKVWDALQQEAFIAQGGLEVERTESEWEIDVGSPLHILALITSLYRRWHEKPYGPAPWAYRNMMGPVMIGGRRLLTVGSEHQAREAADVLEQLGIVHDRGGKGNSPGEWVPETLEDAVELLAENWRKVK